MNTETAPSTPPRWNLSDLFASAEDPAIFETLTSVEHDAREFARRYAGCLAGLSSTELYETLREYERIRQTAVKPDAYASLLFAADASPEVGAFYQRVRETATRATLPLLFLELELSRLGKEKLNALADAPPLAPYCHYLQGVQNRAAFRLSEPEERVLEETANTGRRAFIRLFEEITSNLRFEVAGRDGILTLSQTLDLQESPDRRLRRASADALTHGLQAEGRTFTYIFNTLLQDKATEDRLRGLAYPEQGRHIANELTPEIVETVVQTSESGYGLVARYYEAKRRVLDLPELAHYDRYAPLLRPGDEEAIPYENGRASVLSAFARFHPDYEAAGRSFFDNNWIDAEARPGKRGGAFCASATPDVHPFLFVNYLNKPGDVRTLAHELGHGIHYKLSGHQSYLNFHSTLPMAEVASTFAEMLAFEGAQDALTTDAARVAALGERIEQSFATVFRQTALYRFEQAIHQERRERGELPTARYGELWQREIGKMFGSSVRLEDGHACWWMYIRHFVATPFYVYAYTFGEMLALALFERYKNEGTAFVPQYLEMLRRGGSQSPAELVAPLGVRLDEPTFWQGAVRLLEAEVTAFEKLIEKTP